MSSDQVLNADARPAAPKTRSQSVTDDLRELIVQGEFKPGEHVHEAAAAARLGVSRTPVRAALGRLASEGFLTYSPNRGYTVRVFDLATIMDAYEVRATLEGLAARRAAERGLSREDERWLRECLDEGDAILEKGYFAPEDLLPYRRMNVGIHETIIRAAGNRRLPETIAHTNNIPLVSDRIILWEKFELLRRSHDDHHRAVSAILAREAWRAESIMREHVYFAGMVLRDHLCRHGGLDMVIDQRTLRPVLDPETSPVPREGRPARAHSKRSAEAGAPRKQTRRHESPEEGDEHEDEDGTGGGALRLRPARDPGRGPD